jgi:hypothetical protein
MSEEVKALRAVVVAQKRDIDDLREFSQLELSEKEQQLVNMNRLVLEYQHELELRKKSVEEAIRQNAEITSNYQAELDHSLVEREKLLGKFKELEELHKTTLTNKENTHGKFQKSDLAIKLHRMQQQTKCKALAAYHLFGLKKRRFWDPETHQQAAKVCSIVDVEV